MRSRADQQDILKGMRVERGLSLEQLAEATGISKSALAAYESDDDREIGSYNLAILAEYFGVSADYILGLSLHSSYPGKNLEDVGLTTEAIEVLQSGGYNPLLLSEIITNENFLLLLADASVYVDGNVADQFHTSIKLLEGARSQIIKKYAPPRHDPHLRTLERMAFDDDAFFEHILSEEFAHIMRDIREAHKGDKESKSYSHIVDRIPEAVEAGSNAEGTPLHRFGVVMRKLLGTKDEKDSSKADERLANIMTSGLLAPGEPQKKKRRNKKDANIE